MAKKTVIAVLDVDEKGAVTGISKTTDSFSRMERQATQTAARMQTNMKKTESAVVTNFRKMTTAAFSLQTAAVALVGAFTLGGIVRMIKELVIDATKATGQFDRMAASAEAVHNVLVRNLASMQSFRNLVQDAADIVLKIAASFIFVGRILRGYAQIQDEGLKALNEFFFDNILFGASTFNKILKELRGEVDAIVAAGKDQGDEGFLNILQGDILFGASLAFSDMELAAVRFRDTFTETAGIVEEDISDGLIPAFKRLSVTLDEIAAAGVLVGATLGQAISGGFQNAADAAAKLLQILAVIATGRVATYTAAAAAASTGVGAAVEGGTPAQFLAAAALWKKVAVGAAIGSAFFGGLSSGGAQRGGSQGGFSNNDFGPGQRGAIVPNITINVEGFHGDRNELARELTVLVRRGIQDGISLVGT